MGLIEKIKALRTPNSAFPVEVDDDTEAPDTTPPQAPYQGHGDQDG